MALNVPTMQDLLSAGVHFGHKASRAHPKMKNYIFGARDGVDIINLEKSDQMLNQASQAAYELGKAGSVMLVIGTKKQARGIIESLAKEADTPFLTARWFGGLLTNFEELQRNFKKLISLKDEQTKGTLSRYTKKEQLLISKKLTKFEREAGGVIKLDKNPDAIFVVDAVADNTAVKEANKLGIKVFGICDTNADPFWFDYPVVGNDDGIKSIKLLCETIIRAYSQGKKESSVISSQSSDKKQGEKTDEEVGPAVAEEAAALEEKIEKEVVEESERKI